eukprot:XP_002258149.1 hypothetical protein, conserved in Plasmodium species [Plasmodium knowlesi strain H]
MSNDKLVKLFSLNLGTKGMGEKERLSPMGGSEHASNGSHTSGGVENQSNSFVDWGSVRASTNDSCTSIKSEQLNPYKRVNSLSEYVYKFKKLAHEGRTTAGDSNIFRKFNTNRRKINSSDSWDRSSAQSAHPSAAHFCGNNLAATSPITSPVTSFNTPVGISSKTSRSDSNSHLEFKSIPSGTSANGETEILPDQVEEYFRPNKDFPFSDEEDATISSRPHLLHNCRMFKSHMSIDSSPLCSYLNSIGRLETKGSNAGIATLSRVRGPFQSKDPPLGKTGSQITNLECGMDEKEVSKFFKIAIVHSRVISRHKQNTRKKVRKIFYKYRKMCITVQMSKYKCENLLKGLTYSGNKTLIKNIEQNKNYIYNKKIMNCLFKFFLDYIFSFYFMRNTNWVEARRGAFMRYVNGHILQLLRISRFYRGPSNGKPFPPFKNQHGSDAPESMKEENNHKSKIQLVGRSLAKPSYLLATPDSNVTVGSGNILFPGCYISSPVGHIYIGDNNLFEDNITIINYGNIDMYIGNYNIFRSGTCITNAPTIGDHNYFDYKCSISNSSVGSRSYIRANLFEEKKRDADMHPFRYCNTVTDMSPGFVDVRESVDK